MLGQRKLNLFALFAGLALLVAACGGDDGDTTVEPGDGGAVADGDGDADAAGDIVGDPEDDIEDMVEDLEETQAAQGGGFATLVVGDQEWTFDSVLCAFGEDQIGQEGAVFNLSSIKDGLQMYASIDSFGHSVSLNDIQDFENPSVSLDAFGGEFITLDGKNVTAEVQFTDGTSDSFDTVPGTFNATCP